MSTTTTRTVTSAASWHPPIEGRDGLAERYRTDGWGERSDAELLAAAAAVVRVPRRDPADSFVLHAPLELLARAALLPYVPAAHRDRARLRILSVAAGFADWGPPVEAAEPSPPGADRFDDPAAAAERLAAAVDAGDLDGADEAVSWLTRTVTPIELRSLLADAVVDRTSAAAHGAILLYQLPRVSPRGSLAGDLARGLVRELARYPDWRLRWIDTTTPDAADPAPPDVVGRALSSVTAGGRPAVGFIHPTMEAVDGTGVAAEVLGPLGLRAGRGTARSILRTAVRSMLRDTPDAAPYGWSHALTIPQAVLGLSGAVSDPDRATRIAATLLLGFRASAGTVDVDRSDGDAGGGRSPAPVASAIADGRGPAVAAVLHGDEPAESVVTAVATVASVSHDAHLAKYVLACIDAAAADPAARRTSLAAAASLCGWWAERGDPDDPFPDRSV